MKKIALIGGGAWGTTVAMLLAKKTESVKIWCHEEEVVASINSQHCNELYLPGVRLPEVVYASRLLRDVIRDSELVIFSTPSRVAPVVVNQILEAGGITCPLLNISKGFYEADGQRLSTWLQDRLKLLPEQTAVLSGPNLAREIAGGLPGSTVVASVNEELSIQLQELLNSKRFRVYRSTDVAGVELGGALKNIYALGAGICDGLRFGDNTKAAFLTRCLAEMIRMGEKLGAQRETFFGLSGIGDLMATSMSRYSRNRTVGEAIGRGLSLAEAEKSVRGIAEGVTTVQSIHNIALKHEVELPVAEEVRKILFEEKEPRVAVQTLMSRIPKEEFWS